MSQKSVARASELFKDFAAHVELNICHTAKLIFKGVDGFDVYNTTAPFQCGGRVVIAGRVEKRDSEKSRVVFFEELSGEWCPIPDAPSYLLQDPFVTVVGQKLILGGVEIFEDGERLLWRTVMMCGNDIFDLSTFFVGPNGMKDIRLVELSEGRVGVFTRPQGKTGGRGTIGYTEAKDLDGLTVDLINGAPLLEGMFHALDWGGVNEATLLPNGEIGVLAHIANFENDDVSSSRHYYASSFIFEPNSRRYRDFKIIACRDQFNPGPAKRSDLTDVIFSSGLVFKDGNVRLYAGVSDSEAHWLEIEDPFKDSRGL